MLFYAGVFALVALTASVGAGLAAADRVFMSPGGRIAAQAAHRAVSFAAVAFLAVHIAVEVLAGRSRPSDAVVPFLAHGRTFYLGLGTVASDLLVMLVVTGLLRGRFASVRPAWLWRALHAVAYLCWPLAIMHGLLAGRTAKPYVDWSYGACVAAVVLALVFRIAAGPRLGETAASHAEEAPVGIPSPAVPPAARWPARGSPERGGSPACPVPDRSSCPVPDRSSRLVLGRPSCPGRDRASCPDGRAPGSGAHCPGLAVRPRPPRTTPASRAPAARNPVTLAPVTRARATRPRLPRPGLPGQGLPGKRLGRTGRACPGSLPR